MLKTSRKTFVIFGALTTILCSICFLVETGAWSVSWEISDGQIRLKWEKARWGYKEANLVLQVNNFFWTRDRVFYFNIIDPLNTGLRSRDVLVVDLTVINLSDQKLPFGFCYVIDGNGQRFEAELSEAVSFEERLQDGLIIGPGEQLKGKLAFAVPKGHLPLWLRCADYQAVAKIE